MDPDPGDGDRTVARTAAACALAACAASLALDALRLATAALEAPVSRWSPSGTQTVGGLGWIRNEPAAVAVLLPPLLAPFLAALAAGARSRIAHLALGLLAAGGLAAAAALGLGARELHVGGWQWIFACALAIAAAVAMPRFERPPPGEPLPPEARAAARRAVAAALAAGGLALSWQPGLRSVCVGLLATDGLPLEPTSFVRLGSGGVVRVLLDAEPAFVVAGRAAEAVLPILWLLSLAEPRMRLPGLAVALASGALSPFFGAMTEGRQTSPLLLVGPSAWAAAFALLPRRALPGAPVGALAALGGLAAVVPEMRIGTWDAGTPPPFLAHPVSSAARAYVVSAGWTAALWITVCGAAVVAATGRPVLRRIGGAACGVLAVALVVHADVIGRVATGPVSALLATAAAAFLVREKEDTALVRVAASTTLATVAAVVLGWTLAFGATGSTVGSLRAFPSWLTGAFTEWIPQTGRSLPLQERIGCALAVIGAVALAVACAARRTGPRTPVLAAVALFAALAATLAWLRPVDVLGAWVAGRREPAWALAAALAALATALGPSRSVPRHGDAVRRGAAGTVT